MFLTILIILFATIRPKIHVYVTTQQKRVE